MATAANIKAPVTRWWWVRHAVVPNPEGRCYGQNDMDCDVSDHALFRHQAALLPRGATWVTSGLLRAIKTAETLREHGADWREPVREPRFNEQHFGQWQGLTYADIAANHGDNHLFWLGPPTNRPPGGESFVDLMQRVSAGILEINEAHKGRDIIAVTHGGTIRAALALAMSLDADAAVRFEAENVSLTLIEHYEQADPAHAWRIVFTNLLPRVAAAA
jgi:broad specificity phosphatase PhoE